MPPKKRFMLGISAAAKRNKAKRAAETLEQRQVRLAKQRARKAASIAAETLEQRQARLADARARQAASRAAKVGEMYRQLRKLSLDNPEKFLGNWNPESSNRETRKLTRKIYSEGSRKHILYDEKGVLIKSEKDLCDCLEEDCPGCHMPCPKCSSCKCGHECRNSRRWTYDQVEVEGSDYVIKNKFK